MIDSRFRDAIVSIPAWQTLEELQVEAAVSGQPHGRPYLTRATNEAKWIHIAYSQTQLREIPGHATGYSGSAFNFITFVTTYIPSHYDNYPRLLKLKQFQPRACYS